MERLDQRRRGFNWSMIVVLLIGAWLRWSALSPMQDLLSYDEAYDGLDALSLLHEPRLTPFFPDNFGRESGWMYVLTPFVAIFGAQPLALRLAATMTGVLTIAAMYALSRELLGLRGATWAAAVLAVLYWAVHISTLGLRANLMVLIGALALAAFLRGVCTSRIRWWIWCGIALGALAYTYFAARMWLAVQAAVLIGLSISSRRLRRGAVLALVIAGVLAAPLAAYTLLNPDTALNRIADVGLTDVSAIVGNVSLWLQALLIQGDIKPLLNLPGRPIFEPLLGAVFIIGLCALPVQIKRRWQLVWLATLALAALVPSILSADAPHFLRAIGLVVPISIVAGAGAFQLERGLSRLVRPRFAAWLPAGVIAASALITYGDFHGKWLRQPDVMTTLGRYDQQLAEFVKWTTLETTPVYLPFVPYTPLLDPRTRFRVAYLGPRHVAMFNPGECFAIADGAAAYATTAVDAKRYQQSLMQFAQPHWLSDVPAEQSQAVFTIFQAEPRADFAAQMTGSPIVFGDALRLGVLQPISSTTLAGTTVPLQLGFKALRPLDRDYSVFIHLYGKPRPEAGGRLWGQGDSLLCTSYPTHLWTTHETVAQDFELPIPVDLAPGAYIIAVGAYDSESLERLPFTSLTPTRDYFDLQRIQIKQAGP